MKESFLVNTKRHCEPLKDAWQSIKIDYFASPLKKVCWLGIFFLNIASVASALQPGSVENSRSLGMGG